MCVKCLAIFACLTKARLPSSPLTSDQVATESVRIELFDKGAKLLGGDAFIGEITIPVKRYKPFLVRSLCSYSFFSSFRLLLRHAKKGKDTTEFRGEAVPIISKEKQKAEITVWAEASGWAHFHSLLKDREHQRTALEDFKLLAARARTRNELLFLVLRLH